MFSVVCSWAYTIVSAFDGCKCMACVCLSTTQAACGSYIGIVRTQQGALFPLCLPGAAFHPRQADRLGWLLAWHSLDDLGRKEGRHRAIHGHIVHMANRKAALVYRYPPMNVSRSLCDQKNKCVNWALEPNK